jgi:hypothetical protein
MAGPSVVPYATVTGRSEAAASRTVKLTGVVPELRSGAPAK